MRVSRVNILPSGISEQSPDSVCIKLKMSPDGGFLAFLLKLRCLKADGTRKSDNVGTFSTCRQTPHITRNNKHKVSSLRLSFTLAAAKRSDKCGVRCTKLPSYCESF
jgi:hypothetical protein